MLSARNLSNLLTILLFPILTACGYNIPDARIIELNDFLDKRGSTKIDVQTLLAALTHLKELELHAE